MPVFRVCAMLLLLSFVVSVPAPAQQRSEQQRGAIVPANVDGGIFVPDMLALLRLSDTFRLQCERIAAAPRVHVRLSITSVIDGGGRAQTTFVRHRGGALTADVEVLFGENYRELLAHEFEHVIEQLDGIDLRREAVAGRAWQLAAGAFETRRASLVGVQVLRESEVPQPRPSVAAAAMR